MSMRLHCARGLVPTLEIRQVHILPSVSLPGRCIVRANGIVFAVCTHFFGLILPDYDYININGF